jgi:hypothetical protein
MLQNQEFPLFLAAQQPEKDVASIFALKIIILAKYV